MTLPPPYTVGVDELRLALSYLNSETDSLSFLQPSVRIPATTITIATTSPAPAVKQPDTEKKKKRQKGAAPAVSKEVMKSTPPSGLESTTTTTSIATTNVVGILNLKAQDSASAKVVWASLVYDVPLSTTTTRPKEGGDNKDHNNRPILSLYGEEISGGGNAMALALSLYRSSVSNSQEEVEEDKKKKHKKPQKKKISVKDQLLQDDWCEWERTVLRCALDKKKQQGITAALNHLNTRLADSGGGGGIHIIPGNFTVADIAVLSTLYCMDTKLLKESCPATVQRYLQAHDAAWTQVQTTLLDLVKQQQQQPTTFQNGGSGVGGGDHSSPVSLDLNLEQPSLIQLVDTLFRQVLEQLFGGKDVIQLPDNIVTKCANPKHGDYQCSAAMPAFACLKKRKDNDKIQSPQQVAAAMIAAIGTNNPVVTQLSVAGPGFVMCRLQASLLQYHVNHFLQTKQLPLPTNLRRQVCVVDFSSPNIAKEMHVGHLRSTIIGESVCRILELVGHDVHRVNHVGDWGTQFGMLIQYLKEEYPNVSSGTELPNITDLTGFYKNAKARFDDNEAFKKQSQLNVVQLQSGDTDCLRIWNLLCDISRKEFEKVYKRLDVSVQECGESFYNNKIPAVIDEFSKAGLLQEEEGGAKVVFTDAAKIPLMLQKSDGGYGYDSTDMAALKYRLHELKADRIIVITDFSQGDHFKMVYAAGHAIGWVNRGQRLQHIGFGTVQGEDGKRFKTRSGDTVRLVDLLDEAASRLETSLQKRIEDGVSHISKEEAHQVAEAIGYGSVKYFDLRRNPTSNYKFSYDMMLDTKGDTGVYLLYARVRLESILAKAQAEYEADLNNLGQVQLEHPSERKLAFALQQFPDVITMTLDDLYPYHICQYVYELSIAASDFVTQCRVLGSPEMSSRLLLCQAAVLAMNQTFDLLGIRHVKRI